MEDVDSGYDLAASLQACVVCLATGARLERLAGRLAHHYTLLTGREPVLQMAGGPGIPGGLGSARVCWECGAGLRRGARLRHTALTAQRLLADLLATHDTLTAGDISRLDRGAAGLTSRLAVEAQRPLFILEVKEEDVKPDTEGQEAEDLNVEIKSEAPPVETEQTPAVEDIFFEEHFADRLTDTDNDNDNDSGSEYEVKPKRVPKRTINTRSTPKTDTEVTNNEAKAKRRTKRVKNSDNKVKTINSEKKVKNSAKKSKNSVKKVKNSDKKVKNVDNSEIEDEANVVEDAAHDIDTLMEELETEDETCVKEKTGKKRKTTKQAGERRRGETSVDEKYFTISQLTLEEQIEERERRRLSEGYLAAMFRCDVCYRGFPNQERADTHAVKHTNAAGALECAVCRVRHKSARALRRHVTSQHSHQYSCTACLFTTRTKHVARSHAAWHEGAQFRCTQCPAVFDKKSTYFGHVRIKHACDYICARCGFTFISPKGLAFHAKRKHLQDDAPLAGPRCALCDVTFADARAHERHLRLAAKHVATQAGAGEGRGGLRNDSQAALDRESRQRHSARDDIRCEQCGVKHHNMLSYAHHFRHAHPGLPRALRPAKQTAYPFMCDQCGKRFHSMSVLRDHGWVHTGHKRFKCERCDKSFAHKQMLAAHLKAHAGAKPSFPCAVCGKGFVSRDNRKRHMFIHTGLKPHKCDSCGKAYSTNSELRGHIDHVHLKVPWPKKVRARQRDNDAAWKSEIHNVED